VSFFKPRFKYRESVTVHDSRRQRVPSCRLLITTWVSSSKLQCIEATVSISVKVTAVFSVGISEFEVWRRMLMSSINRRQMRGKRNGHTKYWQHPRARFTDLSLKTNAPVAHYICSLDWIRITNCHTPRQRRHQKCADPINVGPLTPCRFGISKGWSACGSRRKTCRQPATYQPL